MHSMQDKKFVDAIGEEIFLWYEWELTFSETATQFVQQDILSYL